MIELDGFSLTIEQVVAVARRFEKVRLASQARRAVRESELLVRQLVEEGRVIYGVSTGFGSNVDKVIPPSFAERLQENLILSHSAGVGRPLPVEVVRAIMLARANTLARGNSGIRLETLQTLIEMLNKGIHPLIPEKGSVGASGDLAPLSHMALAMMGRGQVLSPEGEPLPAGEAMRQAGIKPVRLTYKEGLALNNGSQLAAAMGALAVHDAEQLLRAAEVALAMTLEALQGIYAAFDPRLAEARPHPGHKAIARHVLRLLEGSELIQWEQDLKGIERDQLAKRQALERMAQLLGFKPPQQQSKGEEEGTGLAFEDALRGLEQLIQALGESLSWMERRENRELARRIRSSQWEEEGEEAEVLYLLRGVLEALEARGEPLSRLVALTRPRQVQDAYSLRCAPQVMGAAQEAIAYARTTITRELNSATDNPLLFPDQGEVLSGGNFHGQPLAQALDLLGMALTSLGVISERRIARLLDRNLNRGLPSFLIRTPRAEGGLYNGLMLTQYTAASLVAENRILAAPASVQSIPTCENQEDHVSMAATAALKAARILENTRHIIAIELICAAQAIDLRRQETARPRRLGKGTGKAHHTLRNHPKFAIPPLTADRPPHTDIQKAASLIATGELLRPLNTFFT